MAEELQNPFVTLFLTAIDEMGNNIEAMTIKQLNDQGNYDILAQLESNSQLNFDTQKTSLKSTLMPVRQIPISVNPYSATVMFRVKTPKSRPLIKTRLSHYMLEAKLLKKNKENTPSFLNTADSGDIGKGWVIFIIF